MDSSWDDLTLTFSHTSMFPFFDIAHYLVSVMAMKHQPGAAAIARKNPVSSWLTAMLHCFGGGILSCILLAEPPLKFLTNHTNVLLASSIWYIIFFCPCDLVSQAYSFLPVQLLAAGMKEVTRTWKIVGGVTHANSYYKNGWIVMIAIGWARGAGGTIVTKFEQLVKGDWKPGGDEWLKMSHLFLYLGDYEYCSNEFGSTDVFRRLFILPIPFLKIQYPVSPKTKSSLPPDRISSVVFPFSSISLPSFLKKCNMGLGI
ncbi:trimeric intracellular cation channel type B isoform X3 [Heterocephalus glaber]|uniref:Trimeric intracellular cation channel type B isoform X3 n=1 Tax=Heterocephalus glaber TaxID=10181 RepID=A0AAX6T7F6_HETGA|nr:trimeric intracellular cation channel type B isoform X3 [Heterocephalus glaber]